MKYRCLKCGGKHKMQMAGKYSYDPAVKEYQDFLNQQSPESTIQNSTLGNKPINESYASLKFQPSPYKQAQGQTTYFDPTMLTQTTNILSEISGRVERGRQDKYDYIQQALLGLMNPAPASISQPNYYNLYAKYGGELKTIFPDYNKYTNDATMKMDRMKKGGTLTPNKAREILHDGTVHGKELTDKQRRYFGAMSKGHTNYRGK